MRIELPDERADRPPLLSSALVFVLLLVTGLAIARGTVGARPPASEEWSEGEADTESDTEAAPGSEAEAESETGAGTDAESEAGTGADAEAEAESEPGAGAEADSATEPETDPDPASGAAAVAGSAAEASAPIAAPSGTPIARGPARGTLVRGRVAYLRCEGGRSGGACNRDRAIEDAIWAQLETLPTCASGPTPPGQADLVVTLDDEGVSSRARDTFADDVTRLDAAATVACLEGAIAAEPVLTGSARRVVLSFRFTLSP